MFKTFYAALVFYTVLPINWGKKSLDFKGIAVYAPLVGICIGIFLNVLDFLLRVTLGERGLIHALLLVLAWLWITGGLHLDGVMDTADGLAVTEPNRRLAVMADSHTGAFGVMAAIAVILLKFACLFSLGLDRLWILGFTPALGRWAQLYAINYHPYLKPEGKGKFHKEGVTTWQVWLTPIFLVLMALGLSFLARTGLSITYLLASLLVAILVANWFNWRLGGQTGDSYGAIVEWTEAIALILSVLLTQFNFG